VLLAALALLYSLGRRCKAGGEGFEVLAGDEEEAERDRELSTVVVGGPCDDGMAEGREGLEGLTDNLLVTKPG